MLTKQDYDILIDSVEVWENKDGSARMMTSMLGAMICKDDEQYEKLKAKERETIQKLENDAKMRRERGIVLRAKLIQMRDSIEAGQFLESASQ